MGALSISVLERTKEIGVLRAIGARSRTIRAMMMMEGTLQGLLSWLIAAPLAFFAGQAASKVLGRVLFSTDLDYSYNLTAVGIWLILVLVIAVLASILPARSATHISVRESLIYE
jgi:putative ABC transport system permease protein